jgi:hypothetical protein
MFARLAILKVALEVIKELLAYLRERRKCTCPEETAARLVTVRDSITEARKSDKDLNLTV